tara:strand:+ start:1533 stop:1718 length:186 start_codon:yes stop_codon:yes gene_type:complete
MKVGDMVMWYSDNVQDIGIVTKCDAVQNHSPGVYISWFSGDGDGWFYGNHPNIGVVSYASR